MAMYAKRKTGVFTSSFQQIALNFSSCGQFQVNLIYKSLVDCVSICFIKA